MKITLEADYAVRIIHYLSKNEVASATEIAERIGVTQRFTLKILRKLSIEGLVSSKKGVNGGYFLKETPKDITLLKVIEAIDGRICVNRCCGDEAPCSRMGNNKDACRFHRIFNDVSEAVRENLGKYTFAD